MGVSFAESSAAGYVAKIHEVELPMYEGEPLKIGLRLLRPTAGMEAIAWARTFAKKSGSDKCDDDDPVYSKALMAARLARACVVIGSDPKSPTPFFKGGAEEILDGDAIGDDHIAYLHELYEIWRDEVSPLDKIFSPKQVIEHAERVAGSATPAPFLQLRPGLRWILHRTMAAMLVTYLRTRSPVGGTGANTPNVESSPSSKSEPKQEPPAK